MGLRDSVRRFFSDIGGPTHPDGIGELQIGNAAYDDWQVVRDFDDLESARAWRQQLTDNGIEAVITADWEPNQYGRGDMALRVPPGKWSEAEHLLGDYD